MVQYMVMLVNITFILYRLTDEEACKNWEEYGNPDGPQGLLAPFHFMYSVHYVICIHCTYVQVNVSTVHMYR